MSKISARLNKAEKKECKQIIKDSKAAKIVSMRTAQNVKHAWNRLEYDHYCRLRVDLDHIGKRPLIDALEADCIDGETLFNTKCYFKHYNDWEINRILNVELQSAKTAISYLEKLAREEIESRTRKGAGNG